MSPRPPSETLVVDANIILSAALGLRSRSLFQTMLTERVLATTERCREEVLGRASSIGVVKEAHTLAASLVATVGIADESFYADLLDAAAETLRLAVASRNGSTNDAHILALAWTLDVDIWSHDRDFAGTGWPSWSSANLRAAVARPA